MLHTPNHQQDRGNDPAISPIHHPLAETISLTVATTPRFKPRVPLTQVEYDRTFNLLTDDGGIGFENILTVVA